MTFDIYRTRILDHFQHPRHRGDLEGMQAVGRASIPMCGDEVEVGVGEIETQGLAVRFRGCGCAVCIASASMMAEAVTGLSRDRAHELTRAFLGWMLDRVDAGLLMAAAPELVETFGAVREAASRARCAALPWGALGDALSLCVEPAYVTAGATDSAAGSVLSAPG